MLEPVDPVARAIENGLAKMGAAGALTERQRVVKFPVVPKPRPGATTPAELLANAVLTVDALASLCGCLAAEIADGNVRRQKIIDSLREFESVGAKAAADLRRRTML